jgi:predicted metal-dependent enzyme (double-stranded beta helix superfamily)
MINTHKTRMVAIHSIQVTLGYKDTHVCSVMGKNGTNEGSNCKMLKTMRSRQLVLDPCYEQWQSMFIVD